MRDRLPRTVLFDLDGTLLDTAPDLAYALNRVLGANGRSPLPPEEIRPHASHGSRSLIKLGFNLSPGEEGYEERRLELLEIYRDNLAARTRLFPGMDTVLDTIEQRGMNWGVVTNKPSWLTDPLMQALNLTDRAACIVSGDTTGNSKPHPEPMLHACRLAGSPPGECLYVGDAARDVEAGCAAGMRTIVALFGYVGADDKPETWGADGAIRQPDELLEWLPWKF